MTFAPTMAEYMEGKGNRSAILFLQEDSPFGEQTRQGTEQRHPLHPPPHTGLDNAVCIKDKARPTLHSSE